MCNKSDARVEFFSEEFCDSELLHWTIKKSLWLRLDYSPIPANIRLDEDVFRLRLRKTSSRGLQDVLIKTNIFTLDIPLQKTSSRRLDQDQYIRLGHTSSRRLPKTFSRRLQNVFKTSCKTSSRRLQDVLKTSSRYLQDDLQRCLQDVFKTYHRVNLFLVTRFQDVFETFSKCF